MRRSIIVGLWLLGASAAYADDPQASDDERPGSKLGASRQAADTRNIPTSDLPTTRTDKPAPSPVSDTPPTSATEIQRGDSPLNLNNKVDAAHAEGSYAGVTIGGQNLPPRPPKLPMRGPQRMTWPGFQVRDGVPTVFLQTTGAPDYAVSETTGALVVTLRGTTIKLRNNQRPLKVAEFGTNVSEISAKPHGRDVIVTIKRKEGSGHRERVEQSAGGFQLLVVELPK